MNINELFSIGASMIQNNSDEKTTNLDTNSITSAFGGLLGGENGVDIPSLISNISNAGSNGATLMTIVSSWIGSGDNMPISTDQITQLFGSKKIELFAKDLGIDFGSAEQALADALPSVVDSATSDGGSNMLENLLSSAGGKDAAIGMLSKMFG